MGVQAVRLFDVFLLGPFMVWMGIARSAPRWASILLALAGLGTIWYNGLNYLRGA